MKFAETINGYNAMGREDAEYEAFHAVAERHTVGGLHCHDFYEFYIHYQGGKVYYVDGSVFPLQNNQLIIMPPFRMHGLVGGSSLQNYERGFLYLRPETLRKLGFGQIDLQRYFDSRLQAGKFYYELPQADALACKQLLIDISARRTCRTRWCSSAITGASSTSWSWSAKPCKEQPLLFSQALSTM